MEKERITYRLVQSPIGEFVAAATSRGCCAFEFRDKEAIEKITAGIAARFRMSVERGKDPFLDLVERQVNEYFRGVRRAFSLPLDLRGSEFAIAVWNRLMKIPYGRTISYSVLAREVGRPGAARAVGAANGANPLPVIIPCHRVVHADGSLGGYGGGVWRKKFLLEFERRVLGNTSGQTEIFDQSLVTAA